MRAFFVFICSGVLMGGSVLHAPPASAQTADGMAPPGHINAALAVLPEAPRVGDRTTLTFTLRDSAGRPFGPLMEHHARKLHVVIVSEDMEVFGHIHPDDFGEPIADGRTQVHFTFPRAGRYIVAVDVMSAAGQYAEQFPVTVAGTVAKTESEVAAALTVVESEGDDRYTAPVLLDEANPNGYGFSVVRPNPIRSGEMATFTWRIALRGAPVTDFRSFLAAPLHLVVVKDDLNHFLHGHGSAAEGGINEENSSIHEHLAEDDTYKQALFGPEITTTVSFPEPGRYYLFGQVAHGESLLILRVPVDVP